jgi:hypothetical protein
MADRVWPRIAPLADDGAAARRREQAQRRELRIAIRQTERAELYLTAIESLQLEDREARLALAGILRGIRVLRFHLVRARNCGATSINDFPREEGEPA